MVGSTNKNWALQLVQDFFRQSTLHFWHTFLVEKVWTILNCTLDHGRYMVMDCKLTSLLTLFALMSFSQAVLTCNWYLFFITCCVSWMGNFDSHLINTCAMIILLAFSYTFYICLRFVTVATNFNMSLLNLRRSHNWSCLRPYSINGQYWVILGNQSFWFNYLLILDFWLILVLLAFIEGSSIIWLSQLINWWLALWNWIWGAFCDLRNLLRLRNRLICIYPR
jgi:hypothetical protein